MTKCRQTSGKSRNRLLSECDQANATNLRTLFGEASKDAYFADALATIKTKAKSVDYD